ncbi:MAG TPA: helix-turn-helix domain-containing protein [Blastocatellia bacterium]|nr:helix-turn-helix domain-containing protein [Blastocatellia bacterium]
MKPKSQAVTNRHRLHQKTIELHLAGKTDDEIAEILGITSSTVKYIASLFQSGHEVGGRGDNQRSRLAYEMRHAGKSFGEISEILNISLPRAHQIVHKYEWTLRRLR